MLIKRTERQARRAPLARGLALDRLPDRGSGPWYPTAVARLGQRIHRAHLGRATGGDQPAPPDPPAGPLVPGSPAVQPPDPGDPPGRSAAAHHPGSVLASPGTGHDPAHVALVAAVHGVPGLPVGIRPGRELAHHYHPGLDPARVLRAVHRSSRAGFQSPAVRRSGPQSQPKLQAILRMKLYGAG